MIPKKIYYNAEKVEVVLDKDYCSISVPMCPGNDKLTQVDIGYGTLLDIIRDYIKERGE